MPSDPAPNQLNPAALSEDDRARLIERLFRDHNRALITFLTARLYSETEARDVAQEAYVRMLQLDRADTIGFHRAYL